MRTTSDIDAVRLYHLDDDGVATTLMYGTLAEAMAVAAGEDEAVQAGLFLQTSNDVVAWLDLIEGSRPHDCHIGAGRADDAMAGTIDRPVRGRSRRTRGRSATDRCLTRLPRTAEDGGRWLRFPFRRRSPPFASPRWSRAARRWRRR